MFFKINDVVVHHVYTFLLQSFLHGGRRVEKGLAGQKACAVDDPVSRHESSFLFQVVEGPADHPRRTQCQEIGNGTIGTDPSLGNEAGDIINPLKIMILLHVLTTFAQKYNMAGNLKAKVSGVFNLTDARYFAAGNVPYIGFCIDEQHPAWCPPDKIREITSWLEGPTYVLDILQPETLVSLPAILAATGLTHVHLGEGLTLENPSPGITIFKDYLLENGDFGDMDTVHFPVIRSLLSIPDIEKKYLPVLKDVCQTYPCFLDVTWSDADTLFDLLEATGAAGIILHGGEEVKTGLKSFEVMDEVLERIF